MAIDEDLLMRFADGELPPEELARVTGLLAHDAEAYAFVQRQEKMRRVLRARFEPLSHDMPEKLAQTVRATPISWRWRFKRNRALWLGAPLGALAAAVLMIAIGLQPNGFYHQGGFAGGALAGALDHQLAADTPAPGAPRIGLSFRGKDGRDCRTFVNGNQAGLACHEETGWRIRLQTGVAREDQGADYGMAGGAMPAALMAAVKREIDGAPFDAASETKARDAGWRGAGH